MRDYNAFEARGRRVQGARRLAPMIVRVARWLALVREPEKLFLVTQRFIRGFLDEPVF